MASQVMLGRLFLVAWLAAVFLVKPEPAWCYGHSAVSGNILVRDELEAKTGFPVGAEKVGISDVAENKDCLGTVGNCFKIEAAGRDLFYCGRKLQVFPKWDRQSAEPRPDVWFAVWRGASIAGLMGYPERVDKTDAAAKIVNAEANRQAAVLASSLSDALPSGNGRASRYEIRPFAGPHNLVLGDGGFGRSNGLAERPNQEEEASKTYYSLRAGPECRAFLGYNVAQRVIAFLIGFALVCIGIGSPDYLFSRFSGVAAAIAISGAFFLGLVGVMISACAL